PGNISVSNVLSIINPNITFSGVNFSTTGGITGSIAVSADSATLFPGKDFTGTASALSNVHYDLSTQAFSLTAGSLPLQQKDFFSANATNVTISFNPQLSTPQTLVSIGSLDLTIKPLHDLHVTSHNLA